MKDQLYANFRGAQVVQVIRVEVNEGDGTAADPIRRVVHYLDLEGKLLTHNDDTERMFRGKS